MYCHKPEGMRYHSLPFYLCYFTEPVGLTYATIKMQKVVLKFLFLEYEPPC